MDHETLIAQALRRAPEYPRPVRGAKVGLLLREVAPEFQLASAGYRNLRAFLLAHPDVVTVEHDGIDIVVAPVERESTGPTGRVAPTAAPAVSVVLRADIWRAFTLPAKSLHRYYDKVQDWVVTFEDEPASDEPEEVREARTRVNNRDDRYVEIPRIDEQQRLEFAREFVSGLASDDECSVMLRRALQGSAPLHTFSVAVHGNAETKPRWKAFWARRVLGIAQGWCQQNNVEPPNLVTQQKPPRRKPSLGRVGSARPAREDRIRERVLCAVKQMPLAELLALRIPVEYLLDR